MIRTAAQHMVLVITYTHNFRQSNSWRLVRLESLPSVSLVDPDSGSLIRTYQAIAYKTQLHTTRPIECANQNSSSDVGKSLNSIVGFRGLATATYSMLQSSIPSRLIFHPFVVISVFDFLLAEVTRTSYCHDEMPSIVLLRDASKSNHRLLFTMPMMM